MKDFDINLYEEIDYDKDGKPTPFTGSVNNSSTSISCSLGKSSGVQMN